MLTPPPMFSPEEIRGFAILWPPEKGAVYKMTVSSRDFPKTVIAKDFGL